MQMIKYFFNNLDVSGLNAIKMMLKEHGKLLREQSYTKIEVRLLRKALS